MKKYLFLFTTVFTAVICCGANPGASLFNDELVMYINFDDAKGAPSLMEGDITHKPAKNTTFIDNGVSGKAFSGGKMSYNLDFNGVSFNTETTFVYWMALMTDDPKLDSKTLFPINLNGKGASMLFQRQGWKKSANILAVLAIPRKKGPLARVFGVSSTKNWKVAEWHMVAVSWDVNKLFINIDGKKSAQSSMNSPLSGYYGDPSGKIYSMGLNVLPNTIAIDEIMVFNRKLSEAELKKLYTETLKK